MAGQEQPTFFLVVLNLQLHIHDRADFQKYCCAEAGGQLMFHSTCPGLTTSSNAGSQHASGKAGKHSGLLHGQKAIILLSYFAFGGSRHFDSPYEHKPEISVWSCWNRKRRKKSLGLLCHCKNNLSQALLRLDQVGKKQGLWTPSRNSQLLFGLSSFMVINIQSTFLFLPSPPPGYWGRGTLPARTPELQTHITHRDTQLPTNPWRVESHLTSHGGETTPGGGFKSQTQTVEVNSSQAAPQSESIHINLTNTITMCISNRKKKSTFSV